MTSKLKFHNTLDKFSFLDKNSSSLEDLELNSEIEISDDEKWNKKITIHLQPIDKEDASLLKNVIEKILNAQEFVDRFIITFSISFSKARKFSKVRKIEAKIDFKDSKIDENSLTLLSDMLKYNVKLILDKIKKENPEKLKVQRYESKYLQSNPTLPLKKKETLNKRNEINRFKKNLIIKVNDKMNLIVIKTKEYDKLFVEKLKELPYRTTKRAWDKNLKRWTMNLNKADLLISHVLGYVPDSLKRYV